MTLQLIGNEILDLDLGGDVTLRIQKSRKGKVTIKSVGLPVELERVESSDHNWEVVDV